MYVLLVSVESSYLQFFLLMLIRDVKFLQSCAPRHVLPAGLGVVLDPLVTQNQLLPERRVPDHVFEAMTSF